MNFTNFYEIKDDKTKEKKGLLKEVNLILSSNFSKPEDTNLTINPDLLDDTRDKINDNPEDTHLLFNPDILDHTKEKDYQKMLEYTLTKINKLNEIVKKYKVKYF